MTRVVQKWELIQPLPPPNTANFKGVQKKNYTFLTNSVHVTYIVKFTVKF